MHRLATCEGCGAQIDTEGHGTWRQIAVWKNVKTNARGAPSDLPPRYMCQFCMERIKDGIPTGQLTFGDALA